MGAPTTAFRMEAVKRTLVLMGVVNDCNVVLRRMAAVRDAWAVLRAHECMAAIVLGDAVLIHPPDRQDRAKATAADQHRLAGGCVSAFPQLPEERFQVRKHDDLGDAGLHAEHVLHR